MGRILLTLIVISIIVFMYTKIRNDLKELKRILGEEDK